MSSLKIKPSANAPVNPMGAFSYKPPTSSKTTMGAMGAFAVPPSTQTLSGTSLKTHTSTQGHPPTRVSPFLYEADTRSCFEVPFGNWSAFRWTAATNPALVNFNLVPHSGYRFDTSITSESGRLAVFENVYALRSSIEIKLSSDDSLYNRLPSLHHSAMAHAVYCSNFIERVGATESITFKICHQVFAGEDVVAEDIKVGGIIFKNISRA